MADDPTQSHRTRTQMSALVRFFTAALLCFPIADANPALGFASNEVGGPGGAPFVDLCRDGDVLIGFNFTAGKDLNTIAAVCQPARRGGQVTGAIYGLNTWGTRPEVGGFLKTSGTGRCPPGTAVQSIEVGVSRHNTLHGVVLHCRNMATGDWLAGDGTVGNLGTGEAVRTETAPCGSGTIATGIVGGYGALVDRLGLICTAYQDPRVQAPAPAPQAPQPEPGPQRGAPLPVGDGGDGGNTGGGNGSANVSTTVYDEPDVNPKFYLEPSDPVTIIQCGDPENWCHISQPVDGWVWGPELDR